MKQLGLKRSSPDSLGMSSQTYFEAIARSEIWWLFAVKKRRLISRFALQVRSKLQGALGRPLALDEASAMSIADIKALQGDDVDAAPADKPAEEEAAPETKSGKAAAPIIHPAKIIDLQRDLPVKLAKKPAVIKKENNPAKAAPAKGKSPSRIGSASSLHVPTTPDRKASIQPIPFGDGCKPECLISWYGSE